MAFAQFVTNRGRVFVAGIYQRAFQAPFVLIDRPSPESSRIFFESSANKIGSLAFATDAPKFEHMTFTVPQPSPNNTNLSIENYFFSSQSLENVEEITTCLGRDDSEVIGLILHFSHGHRGTLGQIRLDSLGERFVLSGESSWFLAFGKRRGIFPYILKVARDRPEVNSDVHHVMELSCTGTLEWIWSERQCLIMYNGLTILPTV